MGHLQEYVFYSLKKKKYGRKQVSISKEILAFNLFLNHYKIYSSLTISFNIMPKGPWQKDPYCVPLLYKHGAKRWPLTRSADFKGMTQDNKSIQMEPRKCRESRRLMDIFLGWKGLVHQTPKHCPVFLMGERSWGDRGGLEKALQMTRAHRKAQESTEVLPLKSKKWLMKTGTTSYSGKYLCLSAKMRAKITIGH